MSKQSQAAQPQPPVETQPAYVWVRNTEYRPHSLCFNTHEKTHLVTLLPGLNLKSHADIVRCCVGGDLEELASGTNDRLYVMGYPTELSTPEALKLVEITISRDALNAWLGMEQRPKVREALTARLASRKVR